MRGKDVWMVLLALGALPFSCGGESDDASGGGSGGGGGGGVPTTGGSAGAPDSGGESGHGGEPESGKGNCETYDCENGALCVSEQDGTQSCICTPGYGGRRCELTLRDCSEDSEPCDPDTSPTSCEECRRPHIAAAIAYTCHSDEGGRIRCWGANDVDLGRICEGNTEAPSGAFEFLIAGRESCAVAADGSVSCWGICWENCEGNVDLETPAGSFVGLSVGSGHACGLDRSFGLVCSEFLWMPPSGEFLRVVSGRFYSCALDLDRRAQCWGSPNLDLSGILQAPATPFAAISAGAGHVCGIGLDGSVECWGENDAGQASPPSGSFRQVSSGATHTCGLREDGTVECWGNEAYTNAPSGTFVEVTTSDTHSCALRTDGKVECWGEDQFFQLTPPPDLAAEAAAPAVVSVGGEVFFSDPVGDCYDTGTTHGCALDDEGRISCWGDPLGTAPEGVFVELSVGQGTACAIRSDGAVACWGNIQVNPESPPSATYTRISTGYALACAIRTSGELECWENQVDPDIQPAGPPPSGTFKEIAVTQSHAYNGDEFPTNEPHACALRDDGSAECWGNGQDDYGAPGPFVQIITATTQNALGRASARHCALDAEGGAWCWRDSEPELIGEGFSKIGTGGLLRTDGTVVNSAGELLSDEVFADVSFALDFFCGLLRDGGQVRCFGSRVR